MEMLTEVSEAADVSGIWWGFTGRETWAKRTKSMCRAIWCEIVLGAMQNQWAGKQDQAQMWENNVAVFP